jgi:hypothetical protein
MTQQAKAILLMFVIGVGHPLVGWSISPAVFTKLSAQSGNPPCALDGTQLWPDGEVMLAAASAPKANKCLEDCARTRQRCEQQDTHRPATKENIEWSKQCQGSYNQCMDGCN